MTSKVSKFGQRTQSLTVSATTDSMVDDIFTPKQVLSKNLYVEELEPIAEKVTEHRYMN